MSRRRASAAECRRCACWILWGLDHDRCAFAVRVSIERLSRFGEAMALGQGRATFELDRACQLWRRERAGQIRTRPADAVDVLAEHVCDDPIPPAWTRPSIPRPEASNVCPF